MDYNGGSYGSGGGFGRMQMGGGGMGQSSQGMMSQMGSSQQQERMLPMGEMVFVDGVHQLYSVRAIPGSDKVFFDKEEDVFFVVCTNHYGQQEIKAFRYEEIPKGTGGEQYVTKQEIQQLLEQFLSQRGGGGGGSNGE